MALCEVCGQPTAAQNGVCARTLGCGAEAARRRRHAKSLAKVPDPPCYVCGHPTRSKYGVCYDRTPECKRENKHRERLAHQEKRRAKEREWYEQNRERHAATAKAWEEANREWSREYHRTYKKAWNAAHPDTVLAYSRKYEQSGRRQPIRRAWLQRTDRPCKRARAGCTLFAIAGSNFCRGHASSEVTQRQQRKRRRTARKLAAAQSWTCTWCGERLAADLAGTHIDHIIPLSLGGPDMEWNLALLHAPCNLSKNNKLTPQAIKLADEHGITIGPVRQYLDELQRQS